MNNKVIFNFLGSKLMMSSEDRENFNIMFFLAILEREQLKHHDGYLWYTELRDKYLIRFDSELEKQIEDILLSHGNN